MRYTFHKHRDSGFSVIEGLLVVVIVIAVFGVGAYVLNQKNNADNTFSSTGNSVVAPATIGSVAAIDKLTQQDSQTETTVDSAADDQTNQNASSADDSLNGVGGSYDESTL